MRKHLLLSGLLALAAAGCTTANGARSTSPAAKAETAVAKALVSDDQENQLGDQVYNDLVSKGTKFSNDPTVTAYLTDISSRLFAQAKNDRPNVNWRILVIDDPKTVNAFSTPGGRLYVYSGLINAASNDAEIAGVMAHEIGHESARHIARSLVEQQGLQTVAGMALGKNPGLVSQVAASLAGNGAMLAHSRGEETEADEYGARYSAGAGFDPQGLITFFQKLQGMEGKTPGVMKYLSDHPQTADRITHLQQYIAANHLSGSDRDASRIANVKAHLGSGSTAVGSTTSPMPPTPSSSPSQQPSSTPRPSHLMQPGQARTPATQPAPGANVPVHR